jgi:hypothetical protein
MNILLKNHNYLFYNYESSVQFTLNTNKTEIRRAAINTFYNCIESFIPY